MAKAPAATDPAEDPRQVAAQFELVQRELQRMDRRLGALEQALAEAQQALSTVQALAAASGEQSTLVPLGGGVHVHARLDPKAPVLVPVGAGYFTEGPATEVVAALEERVASITKSFREASEDAERLGQAAAALNDRLASYSDSP
jgi:prefoldin alpha subunit